MIFIQIAIIHPLGKRALQNATSFLQLGKCLSRLLEGMEIEVEHLVVVALVCLLLVGANERLEYKNGLARDGQLETEGHQRSIVITSLVLAADFGGCFGE